MSDLSSKDIQPFRCGTLEWLGGVDCDGRVTLAYAKAHRDCGLGNHTYRFRITKERGDIFWTGGAKPDDSKLEVVVCQIDAACGAKGILCTGKCIDGLALWMKEMEATPKMSPEEHLRQWVGRLSPAQAKTFKRAKL